MTSSAKVGHADGVLDSKAPVFPMTAPSVLVEEVKLVAAGQKKRRGSYLSFTPEEKARVASVNGVGAAVG